MSVAGSRLGGDSLDLPVAGGQVRVEVLGEGPALMLLHGWTLDRRVWMPQRVLADRLRLVALDRRGFGQSSAPPDLTLEPDDVLALADALGIGRFVVAGQSQGGRVALHLALRAPERVAGVVLLGSALDGLEGAAPEPPVPLAAMRAALEAGDAEAMRRLWADHPFLAVREPATRRLVAVMVADYAGRDLLAATGSLPVTADDLGGLVPPVLALVGEGDAPRRVAAARAIAEAAPRGRWGLVRGAGHLCNLDAPDAVAQAMLEAAADVTAGDELAP